MWVYLISQQVSSEYSQGLSNTQLLFQASSQLQGTNEQS